MNKRNLLYSLIALIGLSAVVFFANSSKQDEQSADNSKVAAYQNEGIDGAVDYYLKLKADPVTGKIDPKVVAQVRNEVRAMHTYKGASLKWEEAGPNNIGGRTRAILIDKDSNNELYAGGVSGGLWRSFTGGQSWNKILLADNIAISCIAQDPKTGDIYVGTGEGLASPSYSNVNSGMYGGGVYKSTDGINFNLLTSTSGFKLVNRIAIDKNGVIYLATTIGLKKSTDGGVHWSNAKLGGFKDVKIAPNSTRIYATSGGNTYVSNDGTTFTKVGVPSSGIGRVEIAVSPSDDDVAYAVLAGSAGDFKGIYRTGDGGSTWTQVAIGGSPSFDLFGKNQQGWYDNVAMVHLTNPDILYVGGIDMWKGVKQTNGMFSWTRITAWNYPTSNPHYVHADHHVYTQVPGNANAFYAGTDGGIFRTNDGGATFASLNRNYNVTQFYAVTSHPFGGIIGGAQDNGTIFMDGSGNNPLQGRKIYGGDGGWAAASSLNTDVIFASLYYSSISRSSDFGFTFQDPSDRQTQKKANFYNQDMVDAKVHLSQGGGPFVSNVILWETTKFPGSHDTAKFVADTNYVVGDTIIGRSVKNNRYPFYHIVSQNYSKGDTVYMADPVQSRLFFGTKNKIYMTPEALYFKNKTPAWYVVATTNGVVNKLRISKDGKYLYYSVNNKLYRLGDLHTAVDSASMDVAGSNYQLSNDLIFTASNFISSIAIDPADPNRVAVTLGGFSSGYKHVYFSSNATSASPAFAAKGGNLPASLPVYAALIPVNNPNQMIIGTENGMFFTNNINLANPVWQVVNDGIDEDVPVYMLHQQVYQQPFRRLVTYDNGVPIYTDYPGIYNYGVIYAATHGRGFFVSKDYVGIPEIEKGEKVEKAKMKLYPNPVENYATVEFKLSKTSNVLIQVYDMQGRVIRDLNLGSRSGQLKERLDFSDLPAGTYFIRMNAGNQITVNKFIKR
jgi:hypothetical protein